MRSRAELIDAERRLEAVVRPVMARWLDEVRTAFLFELASANPGLVAAAFSSTSAAVDNANAALRTWTEGLSDEILPEISVVFGEAFQRIRRADEYNSYQYEQDYLIEVESRLKIWPDEAFEDIRPELLDAMDRAESFDDIKDRVGRILNIDAPTRHLRQQITDIDEEIAREGPRSDLKRRRRELWKAHDASLGEWEWKARRIARTEAHGARETGQLAAAKQMEQLEGSKFYKRWLDTNDDRTRPTHNLADGQMVRIGEKFMVGGFYLDVPGDPTGPPQEIIQCVLGDTVVDWPRQFVERAMRRVHTGAFVHLVTADGHDLTVTPNHPVLTPRGYVPAGRIQPGDDLIASPVAVTPQVENRPSSIKELFGAMCEARMKKRVVGAAVDFHGDATVGAEIEVVWADGLLCNKHDTSSTGGVREKSLGGLGNAQRSGAGDGVSDGPVLGVPGIRVDGARSVAAYGGIGGLGAGASLGGSSAAGSDFVGVADGSDRKSKVAKSLHDGSSADSDGPRHLEDAYAVGMKACEVIQVDRYTGSHWVYNLSTSDAWYTGNGIAVHNCRCDTLILDEAEAQEELQGPNGSNGEIRPGGIRLGPDDPDDAQRVLEEMVGRQVKQGRGDKPSEDFTANVTPLAEMDLDQALAELEAVQQRDVSDEYIGQLMDRIDQLSAEDPNTEPLAYVEPNELDEARDPDPIAEPQVYDIEPEAAPWAPDVMDTAWAAPGDDEDDVSVSEVDKAIAALEAVTSDPNATEEDIDAAIAAVDAAELADAEYERSLEEAAERWEEALRINLGDHEEAAAYLEGISVQEVRKRAFVEEHYRLYGTRDFNKLARLVFRDYVRDELQEQLEIATSSQVVKAQYQTTFDTVDLWMVNEVTFRKYASKESKEWFDVHGRTTPSIYVDMILSGDYRPRRSKSGGDYNL